MYCILIWQPRSQACTSAFDGAKKSCGVEPGNEATNLVSSNKNRIHNYNQSYGTKNLHFSGAKVKDIIPDAKNDGRIKPHPSTYIINTLNPKC